MMIRIVGLGKNFDEKVVFNNFSLEIEKGKCTAIMGESGCGKTTLLNILLGLDRDYSGKISGVPGKLSAVFQENRLCDDFTALSNVQMVSNKQKAKDVLCSLGLEKELKKPVKEFSGGMKRRVAIARALCADYDLLILDEAFKGLDDKTRQSVMNFVKEATKGKTVILVTHDTQEAEFMADKVIKL